MNLIINQMNCQSKKGSLLFAQPKQLTWTVQRLEKLDGLVDGESMFEHVKNAICLVLEMSDKLELLKSTKYMAMHAMVRYLTHNFCFSETQLGVLAVCALQLSAKFNENRDKSAQLTHSEYQDFLNSFSSEQQLLQFESHLFASLDYKISVRSPYDWIQDLTQTYKLPHKITHASNGFIDFALTVWELVGYEAQDIAMGCLLVVGGLVGKSDGERVEALLRVEGVGQRARELGKVVLARWREVSQQEH